MLSIFHLLAAASLTHPAQLASQDLLIVPEVIIESCYPIFRPLTPGAHSSSWRWLPNHSGQVKSAANIRNREFRQFWFCSKSLSTLIQGQLLPAAKSAISLARCQGYRSTETRSTLNSN